MNKHLDLTLVANSQIAKAIATLFLVVFFIIVSQDLAAQQKYIGKYRHLADSLSQNYGIPTCIILGVALLESGSGTSRNCKLLNNHFGIVGKNNLMKTKGIKTRYKQYPSAHASYVDFCKVVARKKFYKELKDNKDYKLWVDAMSAAGYSEVPDQWKAKVIATIQKNNLFAY